MGRLWNKIYLWKPLKRLRQHKCKDCIYAYKKGSIFACYKYYKKWDLKLLRPLRLICFKRKEVNTNEK